jgi:methenyltetrahydromethanopterin cyclohydrolase
MRYDLNLRAAQLVERVAASADDFRVRASTVEEAQILDFGVRAEGGLDAGQALAEICMAGLGWVSIQSCELLDLSWPHVFVTTDHPVASCLLSQYAGWQVSVDRYFAMGSGPMRAAYAREAVFSRLDYREQPGEVVGILEGRKLPDASVVRYLCERTGVTSDRLRILVAPTASQAGSLQIAARSIETALHKLFELGFDVNQIKSACGNAPLAPVAADDMAAIGRTNDAILYGARVTLWVRGDDVALAALGPKVPANSSPAFGKPFAEVFEQAGRDFYKIDPHLFSPAEITFCNLDTGKVQCFGKIQPEILRTSFGL